MRNDDAISTGVPTGTYTVVSVGDEHACALDAAGTLTCWGDDTFGQTDVPDLTDL